MENGRKVIPSIFKRSDREPLKATYSQILMDDEVTTILRACSATGPKTDEELNWALRYCEKIRIEGVTLKLLLEGKILIKKATEKEITWIASVWQA